MQNKALVIIDIQNDITKNYKDIIDNLNKAISWAVDNNIHVIYIRHENLSAGTRTFKSDTKGAELAPDLNIVSNNIFTKYKGNALTSEEFAAFIIKSEINDFYITGADAVACVKSTCYNLCKANYSVSVLSDVLPVMIKKKLMKCCVTTKVKDVKSSLQMTCYNNRKVTTEDRFQIIV